GLRSAWYAGCCNGGCFSSSCGSVTWGRIYGPIPYCGGIRRNHQCYGFGHAGYYNQQIFSLYCVRNLGWLAGKSIHATYVFFLDDNGYRGGDRLHPTEGGNKKEV